MSIIYEALKKAEGGKALSGEIRRKKHFPAGLFMIIALVAASFVFFTRYNLGSKQKPSSPVENLTLQPVEAKEEILPSPPQPKYQLSGIIFDQENPFAIIDGRVLKKSDQIDNYSVEAISQDKVELVDTNDNSRLILSLDSF